MDCPQCHAEVSDGASTCPACGATVAGSPRPDVSATRRKRRIIVLACLAALIVAGIASALVWKNVQDGREPVDAPSQAESETESGQTTDTGLGTSDPKTETPTSEGPTTEPAAEEPPAPLGYPTAEDAARAALEANGNGDYVLAPAREDEELAVYWAGPPQSEWIYEMVVQRGNDGSWSVISMTNIWEDYEVP